MKWPWGRDEPATETALPVTANDVTMTPVDATGPYNNLQSPIAPLSTQSIQVDYPAHSPVSKSTEDKLVYDHDLVMIFPYRQHGEKKKPELYTVEVFVSLMMGKDQEKALRYNKMVVDTFKRVFRTSRCYLDDKGKDLIHIKEIEHDEESAQKRWEAEECLLIAEYESFIKSREPTTEQLFCTLIARAIARRIQLACGLTTRLFYSCDMDEIIMTIRADDNDLRVEADRSDYVLQVSNKPFSTLLHQQKMEIVRQEMENEAVREKIEENVWQQSIEHLRKRRGCPVDEPNAPEMDMLLMCQGEEYQPELANALKRWGHTEEADGLFIEDESCKPLKEESMWSRFYHSLTEVSYDPRTYFSPFAEYRHELMYQPYYRRYPIQWDGKREETLFTQKDRIRLATSIVHRHINTEALVVAKYLVGDMFALHDERGLKDLRESWAVNWLMVHQPLHKIRYYFGEKVALYFAWLGFYTKMLIFPSITGLITFIVVEVRNQQIKKTMPDDDNANQGYILIAFAVFVVIWSAVFSELWKRKNHLFNVVWGVYGFHRSFRYRAKFRGTKSYNPVTDNEEMTFEDKSKRRRAFLVSVLVVFAMVCIVLIALIGLFWFKYFINSDKESPVDKSYRPTITYATTAANAIQIIILNMVYRGVAATLTELENHRTDREYENHLIVKVFLFQFCNSFASFFYIAFLKRTVEGTCLASAFKPDDCMTELRNQLLILFLIRIVVGNTFEVVIPYLKYRYQLWKERGMVQNHNYIENQAKLVPYGNDEAFEDYNEMVIQFGFINLFVVAFPLTPLLALANNAMEVHVDAVKLCYVHRRPFPIAIKSIGAWFYILRVMSLIALGTNSALILWTSDLFKNKLLSRDKWFAFVVACQVCLAITLLVEKTVSDVPTPLKNLMKRYDHIVAVVFKNMSVGDDSHLNEVPEEVNLDIYPNDQWDDRVVGGQTTTTSPLAKKMK